MGFYDDLPGGALALSDVERAAGTAWERGYFLGRRSALKEINDAVGKVTP